MKNKRQKIQNKAGLKAFLQDLWFSDRKRLPLILLIFFLTLFISQKSSSAPRIVLPVLEGPAMHSLPFPIPAPAQYPQKISDTQAPSVSAHSAIVIDVASQVVLYQKDQDILFPPASTTKIMTALVGLDMFSLSDRLKVGNLLLPGSKMGLVAGEQITFENLLYGLLLNSGNDAAETIAQNAPLGMDDFIEHMNKKAQDLSLTHTHFVDVAGLEQDNVTTALDLARLANAALKNKVFAKIVATKSNTVTDVSGSHSHKLENLNKLLGVVAGVEGVKTGFTQEAGQVLVTAVTRKGHTLVIVVLKSEDRFLDSRELLEWAFDSYAFTPQDQL